MDRERGARPCVTARRGCAAGGGRDHVVAAAPAATVLSAAVIGSCARPLPVHDSRWVLREVGARFREFYPAAGDPDLGRDAALLRPRFGLPAIAPVRAPWFDLEVL